MSSQRQASQTSQQNIKDSQLHSQHDELYDPAKSTTSSEALANWLQAPLSDDLCQVPGLGNQYKTHLSEVPEELSKSEEPITTPYQVLMIITLLLYYYTTILILFTASR
jgi:hypothetical protein